jgi:hypothetical protein
MARRAEKSAEDCRVFVSLLIMPEYDEALMWDQLRAAMKDPQKNPFPGFEEHTIDFPPTFKYDVSCFCLP